MRPASRRVRGNLTVCHRVSRSACNASMVAWGRRPGSRQALRPRQRQQQAASSGRCRAGCSRARWAGRGSYRGHGAGGSAPPRLWPRAQPAPHHGVGKRHARQGGALRQLQPQVPLSVGWASTLGRAVAIFSTAIRARASLTGFLPLPMKASMAWVMASMAVAAVMGSGSPR